MMAYAASLHASHDLGLFKNHGSTNQFKNRFGRGCLHVGDVSFSSYSSRLDALSLRLSESVRRPSCHIPFTHNVFKCQSFHIAGQANNIPILKTAVTATARSFKLYCGNPVVLQLVPAVSIIAFAVWGLGPLIRHIRNLFFHRSDSSWQKSSTRYIVISYLQPLMLWTGATLVCRALDPIILPSEASQVVKRRLLYFVRSLSTVLASAYCLSSLIQQTQKFFMETNDSKDTRNMGFQFAGKALYTAVWVAAVALFMELLGFSTQKWLTAGGLGTVLLTLAGREIFTNFLSSVMIHATRPFIVNEWIQTKIEGYAVSGIVEHVGWWSPTIIRGEDREAVHIPNHQFTVNVVRNLSQKTHWRIKTHLAISHLDVSKINSIVADMRKVLAKNPQVEQQRLHRRVFLENINPENQALLILVSCFVKTSHIEEYLCVKEAILLDLLRVISYHRARLATPIRTVQKTYSDADIDNIPFSETIYSRPRAANNRPLLLIEPSYRINGDDKSRSQTRPTRKNEEHDTKIITPSNSKTEGKAAEASAESMTENKVAAVSPNSQSTSKGESSSSLPESKVDPKVEPSPPLSLSSNTKKNPMVAAKPASDYQDLGLAPDGSLKKSKQLEEVGSGGEVDSTQMKTTASAPPVPDFEVTETARVNSQDNTLLGSTVEKCSMNSSDLTNVTADCSVSSAMLNAEQENEKMPVTAPPISRPALQSNIVLGVALEGSKRTLPVEEGTITTSSPPSGEDMELASCQNGKGLPPTEKDNKDGQISGGVQQQGEQDK